MPRAIGWAPALLPSRGSVIARPRFNPESGTLTPPLLREIEEAAEDAFATRCPNSGASVSLRRYVFRRSNFLTIRESSPITRQYSRFVGEFVVSLAFTRIRTILDKSLI
jgi:hypothetical protein